MKYKEETKYEKTDMGCPAVRVPAGCINMPLDQAAALFGMISVGTPVVIHY